MTSVLSTEEKDKLAADLVIANEEKEKRVAELVVANEEKDKRAAELVIANEEKDKLAADLVIANEEKDKRAADLVIANEEKDKRAAELVIANEEKDAVAQERRQLKSTLDLINDQVYMIWPDTRRFFYMNQAAKDQLGWSGGNFLSMTSLDVDSNIVGDEIRDKIEILIEGEKKSISFEATNMLPDGKVIPVEINAQYITPADEKSRIVAIVRDISEAKVAQDKINELAFYDDLTGLPNRRMFYDKLEDEMKRSDRSGLPVVLMLLDLDHFKEVNDTLGHTQGDILLVEVARRITACVRETDTVARLGGDEFTIILSEIKDLTKVNHIAQSIIKSLAYPFQLSEETSVVSGSLGVALYPNDAQNADNLIMNADQAMYVAKEAGRNRFSYFTAALQEAAHARQSLISDLRDALPGKQFALHYQPIVELATGKIYKAEALLRWQHPEHGLVSPAEFIPVAEEARLIHEIGDWVFHEAIRELAHWREMFEPELQISLNVSPEQFRERQGSDHGSLKGFKENWLNQLDRLGLPAESIVFEITEGVLLDEKASAREKLLAMRDAGIQVALDDFGTGYSSLSYLKKFDIDYLKIDQSFVQNMENDANDQALCEAIIVMAHKLGLKVIAEGVETESQRDLLVGFGCEYAQGWLYSKALPADGFEVLLKEQGMAPP
jgi:diguanylate cyclase (GGDEF)-like protein/PAS domain S-box-containing protein